ncbi:hypothetical protein IWQ60_008983 [Tieghemiomyces parasiticus]|uniref:Phospholipid/glycerol acyltransferase domain-containing protein n=1 Tax=Tieghemiomyces parasiticus TaxID=78921 RepID=A0A9W8DKN5_9FUNG|nr:hypothetical protein IWQ60_008983 [Tieghemiomyces parasiticus]
MDPGRRRRLRREEDHQGFYRTLAAGAGIIVWGWFRSVHVIGAKNVPRRRPTIVVSTHSNMVVDPIMLMHTMPHGRTCHFWAKNGLFRNRYTAKIMRAMGAIPVDRDTKNNAELFQHTLDTLQAGGLIGSFPEGTSYTLPHMMELKDGTSWAALEYATRLEASPEFSGRPSHGSVQLSDGGIVTFSSGSSEPLSGRSSICSGDDDTMDPLELERLMVQLVPVGLTYTDKWKWRTGCIVTFGEPINVHRYVADFLVDKRSTVKRLTRDIGRAFRAVTINAPDWDSLHAAELARTILFSESPLDPEDFVPVSQQLVDFFTPGRWEDGAAATAGSATDEKAVLVAQATGAVAQDLRERLLTYRQQLEKLRVTDRDIRAYARRTAGEASSTEPVVTALVGRLAWFMIEVPLSLPGVILHFPVYLLAKRAEKREPLPENRAQRKIEITVLILAPAYLYMMYFIWQRIFAGSLAGFVAGVVLVPLYALYHLAYIDHRYETFKSCLATVRILLAVTGYNYRVDVSQIHGAFTLRDRISRGLLEAVRDFGESSVSVSFHRSSRSSSVCSGGSREGGGDWSASPGSPVLLDTSMTIPSLTIVRKALTST